MAEAVKKPVFQLWMEDIIDLPEGQTLNIAPLVTSCTYTDKGHGESDEISVDIDDFNATLFKGDWMPRKGQGISLSIGYADEPLVPRGRFEVDTLEFTGPPDLLKVRALAAAIKKPLRTEEHRAYEGVSLLDVAHQIARRHGYGLRGSGTGPMAQVRLKRVTQNGEADLAFLKRLAEPYGYVFKVDPPDLVFESIADIEGAAPVAVLDRRDLTTFRFHEVTHGTYKSCEVRYHEPASGRLILGRAGDEKAVKEDTLKINARCESGAQARAMAKESLARSNKAAAKATLTLPGRTELVAGNTVAITGFLQLSGKYLIETSIHRFTRETGFSLELGVKRV